MEKAVETTAPKTLLRKLHSIMAQVDYIQKDKANSYHKYKYASEQAIKESLHPKLVAEGVLFKVDVIDVHHVHGNDQTLTTIDVTYEFINVDDPNDKLSGFFRGCGIDNQDKGLYKAITGAIKYILTSAFLIPTGDDPDNDSESPQNDKNAPRQPSGFTDPQKSNGGTVEREKRLISVNQAKRLWAIARGSGWSDLEVREFLSGKGYTSTEAIPVSEYDGIIKGLEGGS